MRNLFRAIVLSAAGAAAMYYLDPDMGRRRRALTRDKFTALTHETSHLAHAKSKYASDRIRGWVASLRAPFDGSSAPRDDRQLRERIRAKLGRLVSHPGAIEVVVNQGNVSLRGPILADEVDRLLSTVLAMPGVQHIDHRLAVHDEPGRISSLQGGRRPPGGQRRTPSPNVLPLVVMAAPLAVMFRGRAARHGKAEGLRH